MSIYNVGFHSKLCQSSAFMGMAAMILLFPVPGYVASIIQGVQKEKMKKVTFRDISYIVMILNILDRPMLVFRTSPKVGVYAYDL